MIITNNGKPIALLTPLTDTTLEETVSALLNPDGTPAQILNLSISGKIILLYDNRILSE